MARFSSKAVKKALGEQVRLLPWIAQESVKVSHLHQMQSELSDSGLHRVCEEPLKQYRSVATRYDKRARNGASMVAVACILI